MFWLPLFIFLHFRLIAIKMEDSTILHLHNCSDEGKMFVKRTHVTLKQVTNLLYCHFLERLLENDVPAHCVLMVAVKIGFCSVSNIQFIWKESKYTLTQSIKTF
jgi:hypothetical protein